MPCLLENNYYCALNQLRCLEKRLGNNPTLKKKYDQTLSTDLIKNYKKPVEMTEPEPEKIWYLPHHPVQNPNKTEKNSTGGKCCFKVSRTVSEQQTPNRTRSLEQLTWHTATFLRASNCNPCGY